MTASAWPRPWAPEGYVLTDVIEEADMVLLNTCHIREKASEKLYSDLGRLKPLKAEKPDLKIGVAGCVAQAEGEEILRRMPLVDLVVGPQAYHRLPHDGAGEGARWSTPNSRPRTSSTICPPARRCAAHRLPDRAGRLRQVLRLLRGALYPRRRGLAPGRNAWPRRAIWWRAACARSRCWARTSTAITARGLAALALAA
jgi:hypothetical protein